MIFLPWSQFFQGSKTSRATWSNKTVQSDHHMQKIIKHRVNSVMTFLLVVQIFFHQQYHSLSYTSFAKVFGWKLPAKTHADVSASKHLHQIHPPCRSKRNLQTWTGASCMAFSRVTLSNKVRRKLHLQSQMVAFPLLVLGV